MQLFSTGGHSHVMFMSSVSPMCWCESAFVTVSNAVWQWLTCKWHVWRIYEGVWLSRIVYDL